VNVVHSQGTPKPHGRDERRAARSQNRSSSRSHSHSKSDRRGSLRSRREIKPAEERERDIVDAALKLFAERGFNDTTVQDIAAEAGMATGTVYLYFPSKEKVLQGIHDRFARETETRVAAAAVDSVERAGRGEAVDYRDTIDTILDAISAYFRENQELVLVCTKYRPEMVDPNYSPAGQHLGIVARALAAGVGLGMIQTSDPEMTAYLFDAALTLNLHTHITYGDPPDMDRLIAAAKEMFHKTLALPAEQAPPGPRTATGIPPRRSGSRRSGRAR
jgi:AcrR family transcriptional regulator